MCILQVKGYVYFLNIKYIFIELLGGGVGTRKEDSGEQIQSLPSVPSSLVKKENKQSYVIGCYNDSQKGWSNLQSYLQYMRIPISLPARSPAFNTKRKGEINLPICWVKIFLMLICISLITSEAEHFFFHIFVLLWQIFGETAALKICEIVFSFCISYSFIFLFMKFL